MRKRDFNLGIYAICLSLALFGCSHEDKDIELTLSRIESKVGLQSSQGSIASRLSRLDSIILDNPIRGVKVYSNSDTILLGDEYLAEIFTVGNYLKSSPHTVIWINDSSRIELLDEVPNLGAFEFSYKPENIGEYSLPGYVVESTLVDTIQFLANFYVVDKE